MYIYEVTYKVGVDSTVRLGLNGDDEYMDVVDFDDNGNIVYSIFSHRSLDALLDQDEAVIKYIVSDESD